MTADVAGAIWTPGRFRLFLSHISQEKTFVSAVKAELAAYEVDGFLAHEDIEPTRDWQDAIEQALAECDALAAFLHPGFHASHWTDQEVGFVYSRGVLIVPIRLGLDPYGFVGRYQGLAGSNDSSELARRIVDLLTTHPLTAPAMGASVVQMVETSPSYAAARERIERAIGFAHWTPALLGRLEGAIELNRQVRESTGVPEKIRRLVAERAANAASTDAAVEPSGEGPGDAWWREGGAPSFRLSLASSRRDPPWRFEASVHQEGGALLPILHIGWVAPSMPVPYQPRDMEPRRAGEWRLPTLEFDPSDSLASEPLSIKAQFSHTGRLRTQRWRWERAGDFQNVEPSIERA